MTSLPQSARLAVLFLTFAFAITACSLVAQRFEKPTVSVVGIQLVSGNFLQQNFLVTLDIQNPNDRALPVTSLHADLNVLGEKLASGANNRAFVVPARGGTQFEMTITANMALALLKLSQRKDHPGDSIDYDLTGGASIDLPFLRDLPFHQHGSFSLSSFR